jgi:anaerobic selenocysteine-containing dehydrogenase
MRRICPVPPGTDVALIWGILYHIFENGWEDKEFIRPASGAWTRSRKR